MSAECSNIFKTRLLGHLPTGDTTSIGFPEVLTRWWCTNASRVALRVNTVGVVSATLDVPVGIETAAVSFIRGTGVVASPSTTPVQ